VNTVIIYPLIDRCLAIEHIMGWLEEKQYGLAYFYFNPGGINISTILKSLLRQVFAYIRDTDEAESLFSELKKLYNRDQEQRILPTDDEVMDLLCQCTSKFQGGVFLVFDGMDEPKWSAVKQIQVDTNVQSAKGIMLHGTTSAPGGSMKPSSLST
jgi:hypothetical protein